MNIRQEFFRCHPHSVVVAEFLCTWEDQKPDSLRKDCVIVFICIQLRRLSSLIYLQTTTTKKTSSCISVPKHAKVKPKLLASEMGDCIWQQGLLVHMKFRALLHNCTCYIEFHVHCAANSFLLTCFLPPFSGNLKPFCLFFVHFSLFFSRHVWLFLTELSAFGSKFRCTNSRNLKRKTSTPWLQSWLRNGWPTFSIKTKTTLSFRL